VGRGDGAECNRPLALVVCPVSGLDLDGGVFSADGLASGHDFSCV